MNYIYPAKFAKDNDGYTVTFRDVPQAITQGDDLDQALINAADALEEAIAAYIDDGLPIPAHSKPKKGERCISLPTQTAFKAAIYQLANQQHVSKSELARRLDVDEKEARRILDPHHETKVRRMEAALKALGGELHFTFANNHLT